MNVDRLYNVIREPHITEKTTRIGENAQYGFKVAPDATKPEIKEAVEKLFGVNVLNVTTATYKGKTRDLRLVRNGRMQFRRSRGKTWKKAYVRIQEAQVIDVTELD